MIRIENVSKSFNGRPVLSNVHFHVRRNEVVGLLGRSGAGKSTVLRMISGLTFPDRGTVLANSTRIGYIFQEPRLIPWRTALDNVCFVLRATGCDSKPSREIATRYLNKMGLGGFEGLYPEQLSGGMRQRVAIARAFAAEPDVLLMDEPFSALDPGLKDVMHALIEKMLHERPVTVLYVSHHPEEVARIATRVCMITPEGGIRELSLNGADDQRAAVLADRDWSSCYGRLSGIQ